MFKFPNVPVPEVVHTTPPALVKVPARGIEFMSPQTTWFEPASIIGAGSIMIVILSDSGGHPSLSVVVKVNVTLPAFISAGVGV